ncbi:MAG: hypothetical protein ACHQPI_01635 [Thermoanaerobaculia bacterium]
MKRLFRVFGWGLMGFLSLTVLVVLATNVFLRTSLLRSLVNGDPDSLVVGYRGAACWFPGHLSFDSLTLRSRDHNVEFEAALHGVELRVSLVELLGRRFHATRVRAKKLGFRLRERLRREQATPARLARYPRIAGFADPPLLQTTTYSPESAGNPWRVVIEDLSVTSVEEIWIDAWRWTGEAKVAGAFELLPGREARVGPARLEVAAGELQHGTSRTAERTFGAVWCELPRFDTQAYPGNDVWKIMSGGSELRGDLAGLAFLSSDAGGPRLSGGTGTIRERVGLKDGVGSVRLEVSAREVTVREGKRTFRGSARVDIRATGVDFRRGEASLAETEVILSDVAVGGAPSRPWAATFSAPAARLFFADGSFDALLAGTLRDARPVVALLPSGLTKWVAILLDLENLHVTGRLAAGPSRLALTSLRLSAGNFSLEGDYRSSSSQRHGEFRAKKGPLSIRFTIPSGS